MEELLEELTILGAEPETGIRRLLGDERFYLRLIRKFLKSGDWQTLREAVELGRAEEAFLTAHRMKGSVADLSLLPFQRILSVLTESFRAGTVDGTAEAMEELYLLRDRFREVLADDPIGSGSGTGDPGSEGFAG